jgi:hypothetical protein
MDNLYNIYQLNKSLNKQIDSIGEQMVEEKGSIGKVKTNKGLYSFQIGTFFFIFKFILLLLLVLLTNIFK